MFEGHGVLALEGDHLDICYGDRSSWPDLTPGGSIKAYTFNLGDPVAGPNIQLGLMSAVEGETLDWPHSIDPPHHHGSDQFRVISGGEWILAGKRQTAGEYSFQEAGRIYREHPGAGGAAWMLLVMGDRRGTQSTLAVEKDKETLFDSGELFGVAVEGLPYPHPAGDRGIPAIATTRGACRNGYLRGRIAALGLGETEYGSLSGVFGDAAAGPIVHILSVSADRIAIPACSVATEMLLLVVSGSCRIGAGRYAAGEMRVQRANAMLDDVVAESDGVEIVLLVADRRAQLVARDGADRLPGWAYNAEELASAVDSRVTVRGGPRRSVLGVI